MKRETMWRNLVEKIDMERRFTNLRREVGKIISRRKRDSVETFKNESGKQ